MVTSRMLLAHFDPERAVGKEGVFHGGGLATGVDVAAAVAAASAMSQLRARKEALPHWVAIRVGHDPPHDARRAVMNIGLAAWLAQRAATAA